MGCAIQFNNFRVDLNNSPQIEFNGNMLKLARESRGYDLETLAKETHLRQNRLLEIEEGLFQPTEHEVSLVGDFLEYPKTFFYLRTYIKDPPDIIFICGEKIRPCFNCGAVSDWLCDYPIGEGKTCSLPLCDQCRTHDGKYDYCSIHHETNKVIKRIEN